MLRFQAPTDSDAGAVQVLQYARWLRALCPATPPPLCEAPQAKQRPLRDSGDGGATRAAARRYCAKLRDATVWHQLLLALREQRRASCAAHDADTAPSHQGRALTPPRSGIDGKAPELRALGKALDALRDEVGAGDAACEIPPVQDVHAGSIEAAGRVLFASFHHAVVRDRLALHQCMLQWYCSVAVAYGRETAGVDAGLTFLRDGTLWVLAMHNASRVEVELSTVYEHPANDAERAANLGLAFALFSAFDLCCFFPTVDDFLHRCNAHFLFMQAFVVFQRFCGTPVVPVGDLAQLRTKFAAPLFADSPAEGVFSGSSASSRAPLKALEQQQRCGATTAVKRTRSSADAESERAKKPQRAAPPTLYEAALAARLGAPPEVRRVLRASGK